jgi:hypothetical protein
VQFLALCCGYLTGLSLGGAYSMASILVCAEDERCSDSTKDLTNVALMEAAGAYELH